MFAKIKMIRANISVCLTLILAKKMENYGAEIANTSVNIVTPCPIAVLD